MFLATALLIFFFVVAFRDCVFSATRSMNLGLFTSLAIWSSTFSLFAYLAGNITYLDAMYPGLPANIVDASKDSIPISIALSANSSGSIRDAESSGKTPFFSPAPAMLCTIPADISNKSLSVYPYLA